VKKLLPIFLSLFLLGLFVAAMGCACAPDPAKIIARAKAGDPEAKVLEFWFNTFNFQRFWYHPLTITAVECPPPSRSNAGKSWVVTFDNGARLRTDDPARAFGASPEALPGQRMGIRIDWPENLRRFPGLPRDGIYAGDFSVRPLLPAFLKDELGRLAADIADSDCHEQETRLVDLLGEPFSSRGSGLPILVWEFDDGTQFWFPHELDRFANGSPSTSLPKPSNPSTFQPFNSSTFQPLPADP
jgi:hypothetical protein